ncbi:hypothetical protein CEW87_05985 [Parazoarcus communis]|uniref:Efflux transporter periplasmic adaptor subunit n=1 Tax=Parazoarcus communis TaxID=41977 RepID=A0A2U8GZ29_9RHOO|nr:efflux RND transporter periplasmic adaptor subunit [Parazoarcus communis]AWI78952.1 hypothetical protein CEW87_05985 [Parazoarcus communis]
MNKILCFSLLTAFATMTSAAPPPQPLGCLIQADQVAELGSAVTGIIDSIKVERGDTVRRGQVLATLRDAVERAQIDVARSRAEIEAEIRGAQANLDLANDRQRRANDLFARNFVSSQAVEQADADVRIAQEKLQQARDLQRVSKRELDLAEARLSERVVRSPFDGVVTDRFMSVGERVEERALLRVAKLNPLRVEVVLPNTLYGSIEPGMVADIRPDLPGLDLINATVTRVDKVLDAASNTFRARLELPNPNNRIPAGVRCKASFANAGGAGTETAPQPKATAPRASSSRADMSFDTVLTRFRPGQQPRPERRL